MRPEEEIREELQRLLQYKTLLENKPTLNAPKIALLTMRIDAIKWVLNLL